MRHASRTYEAILDDRGFTLPAVLGIVALMTVVAVGSWALSQQALNETVRTNSKVTAFEAANSGVDAALQRIQTHNFLASDFPVSYTFPNGSSFVTSVTPAGDCNYLCVSTGRDRSGAKETVKVAFFSLSIWNMEIGAGEQALGGGSVRGTTSVWGPLYVRGTLALGSNSQVEEGPLFVNAGSDPNAGLVLEGNGKLGQISPINVYCNGVTPPLGDKNFGAASVSISVPNIALPPVDASYLSNAYNQAKSESIDNEVGTPPTSTVALECTGGDPMTYTTMQPPNSGTWARSRATTTSSFYKVVGVNSGWGPTPGGGTHGLNIGSRSFGSWYGDGHTTTPGRHDDFAFDAMHGILYVEGTVFIDGPLSFTAPVHYVGNGAIVVNGGVTVQNTLIPNTADGHMDAGHVLGIVTPTNMIVNTGTANEKDPEEVPDVCGAFFVGLDFGMNANVLVRGSVLASSISFNHPNEHLRTELHLPEYLPAIMPGNGVSILSRSSWVRQ